MSGEPGPSLVCCGLIGATVQDDGMLERAFAEACATQGIVPGTAAYAHCMVAIHQARGQPPLEVFRGLFPGSDGRAEAATLSFERAYRTMVERTGLVAVPGAAEAVASLRSAGLRVCVITGLSRRLLGMVLDSLDWSRQVDLALCADDVPRGCPWPDLILTAMLRLGVEDVRETVFAGSTASGVLSGRRAGAGTVVGVLVGGHTADRLRASGTTHLIGGLGELPGLLAGCGPDGGPGSGAGERAGPGSGVAGSGDGAGQRDAAGPGVAGGAEGASGVEPSGAEVAGAGSGGTRPAGARPDGGPAGGGASEVVPGRGVPLERDGARGPEAELKSEPGNTSGGGGSVRGKTPGRGVAPGSTGEMRGTGASGTGSSGWGTPAPRVVAPARRAVPPAPRVSLERRSAGL